MTQQATWQYAEVLAAQTMRMWGYLDARVTRGGADGGIDVRSARAVAQVKHLSRAAGRPDVQRLFGAAPGGVDLFFFSYNGFSAQAIEYSNGRNIRLIEYDLTGRTIARSRSAIGLPMRAPAPPPRSSRRPLPVGTWNTRANRWGPPSLMGLGLYLMVLGVFLGFLLVLGEPVDREWYSAIASVGVGYLMLLGGAAWFAGVHHVWLRKRLSSWSRGTVAHPSASR
ncbi:MAG: restriction endonuclease [Aeromicrobium erythreum]